MGQQQLTDKTTVKGSSDAIDQPVTVTIGIPKDLPSDIFPLQFRIEAKDNNLSTTDPNLPVQDGLSTFEDKQEAGKRSFYYIATIKYTEYKKWNASTSSYDYKTEWPFTLYTTKTSGNGTDIRLSINSYDQADWTFAPKTLTLKYE